MEFDHYQAPKFSLQDLFTPQVDNRKTKEWNIFITTLQSFCYRRCSRPRHYRLPSCTCTTSSVYEWTILKDMSDISFCWVCKKNKRILYNKMLTRKIFKKTESITLAVSVTTSGEKKPGAWTPQVEKTLELDNDRIPLLLFSDISRCWKNSTKIPCKKINFVPLYSRMYIIDWARRRSGQITFVGKALLELSVQIFNFVLVYSVKNV